MRNRSLSELRWIVCRNRVDTSGLVIASVEQGLRAAFDVGEWGAEFVADVWRQIPGGCVPAVQAGEIVKDQDRAATPAAAVGDGCGIDLEPASDGPRAATPGRAPAVPA